MEDQQSPVSGNALRDLRIIFMGTPEFAVASLAALLKAGARVVAVITAPDKPAGRGMKLQESDVKKFAKEKGLTILQPEKLKDPAFLEALKALQADLQIIVAFRMLPEVVWNMPPMGTINLHGSLLPQYRGAAPINWAIINGETETGVTTFRLKHEIDTGDLYLQEKITIGEDETAGEIHDRMKEIGAALLVRTVVGLADGTLRPVSQDELPADLSGIGDRKYAPKIFSDTCKIEWNRPVRDIYNQIRGLSPYPGAFTFLDHKILKISRAEKQETAPSIHPGEFETDQKSFLRFACNDGYISVKEIQLEGKKKLQVEDFLRGYRF